jgi:guanosine-3',5'-bis(diphosphate) 3'-pyrophosphohydrolase
MPARSGNEAAVGLGLREETSVMANADDYRTLLQAISFASRAHHGQMRKDGRTPYVSHVFRVCTIVRTVFGFDDPRMLTAAVLHDTLEDTTSDFDDIEEQFGREVATWVATLSKDKRLPEPDREADYLRSLQQAPWQVQACKLADVYDNLLDSQGLTPEKRRHAVERAQSYLSGLEAVAVPQTQKALALARELLVKDD